MNVANSATGTDITGTFYAWGQVNNAYVPADPTAMVMPEPTLITRTEQSTTLPNYRGGVMILGGDGVTYTVDGTGRLVLSGGTNNYGELGRGTTHTTGTTNALPQFLQINGETVTGLLSAASGEYHTTLVTGNGDVFAFGLNNMNQLGNQSLTRPYQNTAYETGVLLTVEGIRDSVELMLQADLDAPSLDEATKQSGIASTNQLWKNNDVAKGFNLMTNKWIL